MKIQSGIVVGLVGALTALSACAHKTQPAQVSATVTTPSAQEQALPSSPGGGQIAVTNLPAETVPSNLTKVHFDFDQAVLHSTGLPKLQKVADELNADRMKKIEVDGNCDERGSEEYNMALGERRAVAVKDYLQQLGVLNEQVQVVSYGKDRPLDPGHSETAWAKNRRADVILTEIRHN